MITEIEGDLFAVPGLDALAHGVNCRGMMGAGIAVEFKRRWPAMFRAYEALCRVGGLRPGDVFPWYERGRWVFNLATQARPGPHATIPAIRAALAGMVGRAEREHLRRIGMPRIGCGYGGLFWDEVRPVVAEIAEGTDVKIVVVSLPEARR